MVNSIVGESTTLRGDFEIDGVLRIDGRFQGSIKGKSEVIIGEKAQASLDLEANDIIIGGKVEGKIKVRGKVRMLPSGHLKGEVMAGKIIIEPGAFFSGQCKMWSE